MHAGRAVANHMITDTDSIQKHNCVCLFPAVSPDAPSLLWMRFPLQSQGRPLHRFFLSLALRLSASLPARFFFSLSS
eukprot:6204071-Pleurochrysis_carterae.AAC.1